MELWAVGCLAGTLRNSWKHFESSMSPKAVLQCSSLLIKQHKIISWTKMCSSALEKTTHWVELSFPSNSKFFSYFVSTNISENCNLKKANRKFKSAKLFRRKNNPWPYSALIYESYKSCFIAIISYTYTEIYMGWKPLVWSAF